MALLVSLVGVLWLAGAAQARTWSAETNPGMVGYTEDAVVPIGSCFATGQRMVAPGAVVLQFGWVSDDTNLLRYFLRIEHTTFSINGGPSVDASSDYGTPVYEPLFSGAPEEWEAPLIYNTGLTLNSGRSMTISGAVSTWLPFLDMFESTWTVDGPGVIYSGTCTVTAA